MEPAAMVRCAHSLMHALKEDLAERGQVEPVFVLLLPRCCDLIAYDPTLLTSIAGKRAIAVNLRRKATERRAEGAPIAVDSFCFVPDPEAIHSVNQKLVQAAAAAGIDALVAAGLGRKIEAISVNLQTSDFHLLLQQPYTRESSIVFGERTTIDSRDYGNLSVISGGIFDIFPLRRMAEA